MIKIVKQIVQMIKMLENVGAYNYVNQNLLDCDEGICTYLIRTGELFLMLRQQEAHHLVI